MKKHLVLVGGGHAHMVTLKKLTSFIQKGHTVTVIAPSDYHYYSGMAPGVIGGRYAPSEIRFATRSLVEQQGGRFVLDRVIKIEGQHKRVCLESGRLISYDVLSVNTGSYVSRHSIPQDERIFPVKPIEHLIKARDRIHTLAMQKPIKIAIVGGGAASVEIAGNIWRLARLEDLNPPLVHIFAGETLLARFPEPVRIKAATSLGRRGIEIHEHDRVTAIEGDRLIRASGKSYRFDLLFWAIGVLPSAIFVNSGMETGPEGGLKVNRFLQSTQYPEIFGGGDCIDYDDQPLEKVGVYAVRQNPILYHNLMTAMNATHDFKPFDPGGAYLLVLNMGDGTGIFLKKKWVFAGKSALILKEYLDKRFVKIFQKV